MQSTGDDRTIPGLDDPVIAAREGVTRMAADKRPIGPTILLVEDDANAAFLIGQTLCDQFGPECVVHRRGLADATTVDLSRVDLVLTDMRLPDGTGLELLGLLLARRPDLPVVMVTGDGILENAIAAIRRGAYDYVVKAGDYLFAIPLVVEKNLALYRVKQENLRLQAELERSLDEVRVKNQQLEEMVQRLETIASTDPLTGLANRRAFSASFERRFAEAQRHNNDLACIMIDLDGFKQLNDTLGHRQGDEMLQRAATVLAANCRRSDIAGRFGGDEFILVLPQADAPAASAVAERISEEFTRMAALDLAEQGYPGRLTMSLGLATLKASRAAVPEQLIEHADHALYCAKQAGKTRLVVYDRGSRAAKNGTIAAASRI
jgi:two-component system cell cycle response regulator